MTPSQWLASDQFAAMLRFAVPRATPRQLRLLGIACCRMLGHAMTEPLRETVALAERLVEPGAPQMSASDFFLTLNTAHRATKDQAVWRLMAAFPGPNSEHIIALQEHVWFTSALYGGEARRRLCGLLRDVIGDPFRPPMFVERWRTADVLALARAAHEERSDPWGHFEPDRLAVLADALEDAGCTDDGVLSHLRSGGVHVRGCWAVELLLGER